MQRTLVALNLLKAEAVRLRVEGREARSCPFLILLRIVLPQARHILRHLFQHLGFEVTGLTRAHLSLGAILGALESCCGRREGFELPFLGGGGRGGDVSAGVG